MTTKYFDVSGTAPDEPIRRFQNITNESGLYTLIWLGKNVEENNESVETQKKLKQAIDQLKVFEDLDECVDYLTDLVDQKVVMIVSESSGRIVVPVVNDFPQLKAVYVYSFEKKMIEGWSKENEKVISTFIS